MGGWFALGAYAQGLWSTANLGVWWDMWAELGMEKQLQTGGEKEVGCKDELGDRDGELARIGVVGRVGSRDVGGIRNGA